MRSAITRTLLFLAVTSGRLSADEPARIIMSIEPRAIEAPVLKYRLLPSEMDKKPGNAAPILLRMPWDQQIFMSTVFPKFSEWADRELDDPAWAGSNGVLPENFYGEMKRAAYRRDATWEYPIGEVPIPYMILLPDVQGLRVWLGQGLSARIRYHIGRGELDQAREGIMVGLANSRHMARGPFYIVQMVARAIDRVMLERIDEVISQSDSPNLYWALAELPDSLLDMNRAASLESEMFASTLPAVRDFDRPRDAKEWTRMAQQMGELLKVMDEIPQKRQEGALEPVTTFFSKLVKQKKRIDQAKADLSTLTGMPEAQVAKMSDDEVSLRWFAHLRIAYEQRLAAVMSLSPREAWPELAKLDAEQKSIQEKTETKPSFFDPATVYFTSWSLKRKIQAQRIVEAVRHHLATNEGKLPASLDEIKDVPIPNDPLTDRPFIWTVDRKSATLKAPPLPANAVIPGSPVDEAFKTDFTRDLEYQLKVE